MSSVSLASCIAELCERDALFKRCDKDREEDKRSIYEIKLFRLRDQTFSIITRFLFVSRVFVGGSREIRHISLPIQDGAEGRVRRLLTKNPACSFSSPLPETRYLV